jgi:hypothetical protein
MHRSTETRPAHFSLSPQSSPTRALYRYYTLLEVHRS